MALHEHEQRSLAELDAADQAEVERVEAIIIGLLREHPPATISQLSEAVRVRVGDLDNAVIRAALLRLLNRDELRTPDDEQAAVA